MDRPTTRKDADARGSRLSPHEAFVLPSRRPALELCREIQRSGPGAGPILLTGDAGSGKTWLWRVLETEAPVQARWIAVDLTPASGPADFYRLMAHELGLAEAGSSRVELVEFLIERQSDGERLSLVIEEAHNLSAAVWEEVRVLANRFDRPGGFASMLLVGQTSLARRFSTRPFASIEARLAARVHLGPIDADEAKALLDHLRPGQEWPVDEVEARHRDALGNPRRMLRKLGPAAAKPVEPAGLEPEAPVAPIRPVLESPSPAPLTGPAKPPIRVEDNMIEVGWSPEDVTPPPVGMGQASTGSAGLAARGEGNEEAVKDHYAALQAWREWTENQARRAQPAVGSLEADEIEADEIEADEVDEIDDEGPSPSPADRPKVRAEGEQKFAPFSHLFSRMAQAREPE